MSRYFDKVFAPGPGRVFVFGSNQAGMHGGGAARAAHVNYGAEWGVGEGLTGASYALPTKDWSINTLPIAEVAAAARRFMSFARSRSDLQFFLTRVGCGLAGFTDDEIAPLFRGAPDNVEMPGGWER